MILHVWFWSDGGFGLEGEPVLIYELRGFWVLRIGVGLEDHGVI